MVHIGETIGLRVLERRDGRSALQWDAQEAYGFPTSSGQVIHGGMVTTLLDTAMGGACWSVLDEGWTSASTVAAELVEVFGAPGAESDALAMTESALRALAEHAIVELDDGE